MSNRSRGRRCFSLTASRSRCLRSAFARSGLQPTSTDLGDGTMMHCWVPRSRSPSRPDVVLIHGFGADALWQFDGTVRALAGPGLANVYVPDLLFFGGSATSRPERGEEFQAACVRRVLEAHSVLRVSAAVGLSYGGFVAYSMAAQFPESVNRVVVCCAGVCLEERDLREGLFPVKDIDDAADILLPQTATKMRELLGYTFSRPPRLLSCLLQDFIDELCSQHIEERRELLRAIVKDRKLSDLPKISQPTLIVWGDQDKVFPVELAHRLQRYLGEEKAELVVIKNTGHAFIQEKPKEFYRHLKAFIFSHLPISPTITNHHA